MSALSDNIVRVARSYVGKRELGMNNTAFEDAEFQKKIAAAGWHPGDAWCSFYGEVVWKEGFGALNAIVAVLSILFSGSAVATWNNFRASKHFKTGQIPKPGALAIFQFGKTAKGHLAVVLSAEKNKTIPDQYTYATSEGNSNVAGSRDGGEVALNTRQTGLPFKEKGLNLLGFVYPD